MVAFTYRMPSGIPGTTNRNEHLLAEPQLVMPSNPPLSYGIPVALDATTKQVRPVGAGDTAALVIGFNIRPFPTTPGSFANQALGQGTPMGSGVVDVMRRGYMHVLLGGTAPAAKGNPVHIRIATASAGKPIGGIEAAADGANTISLATATFVGPADAQGNVEIAYNL